MFNHPQIIEEFCDKVGVCGSCQRNLGIDMVKDGHIYFLDDDNIVHPEFWNLKFDPDYFYTFNQNRTKEGKILTGDRLRYCEIDTAMFVVPKKMFDGIRWITTAKGSDGYLIAEINARYPNNHKYINRIAAYYNYLT